MTSITWLCICNEFVPAKTRRSPVCKRDVPSAGRPQSLDPDNVSTANQVLQTSSSPRGHGEKAKKAHDAPATRLYARRLATVFTRPVDDTRSALRRPGGLVMAPTTRSGGAPPPSRVYHSTPALQQVQFPSRRRPVGAYGWSGERRAALAGRSVSGFKQQTLTQINFVPGMLGLRDRVALSDSEDGDDNKYENKENEIPCSGQGDGACANSETAKPTARARKTQGAAEHARRNAKKRRFWLNDEPVKRGVRQAEAQSGPGSGQGPPQTRYHTQTPTPAIQHRILVQDSDDDDDDYEDADACNFEDWLGRPSTPSPAGKRPSPAHHSLALPRASPCTPRVSVDQKAQSTAAKASLGVGSIVPQTPNKRIPFEIPSSSQATSTPPMNVLVRYPAPDKAAETSPSVRDAHGDAWLVPEDHPGRPNGTVGAARWEVQDSFAASSWESPVRGTPSRASREPLMHCRASGAGAGPPLVPSSTRTMTAHTDRPLGTARATQEDTEAADYKPPLSGKEAGWAAVLSAWTGVLEIPDSEDDTLEEEEVAEEVDDKEGRRDFAADSRTRTGRNKLVGRGHPESPILPSLYSPTLSTPPHPVPSSALPSSSPTSSALHQRDSSVGRRPSSVTTIQKEPFTPEGHAPKPPLILRKPIRSMSSPAAAYTQPIESQRVPLHVLHALPSASARSDILLPVSHASLSSLVSGCQVHMELPFKIPPQVSRFWLLNSKLLRFVVCVTGNEPVGPGAWRYSVSQMFELNNPVDEESLRAEFLHGTLDKYKYVPPVMASRYLYNLRQAVFGDGEDQDEHEAQGSRRNAQKKQQQQHAVSEVQDKPLTKRQSPISSFVISQEVEAQLRSDMAWSAQGPASDDVIVPSTQIEDVGSRSRAPARGGRRQPTSPAPPSATNALPSLRHTHRQVPSGLSPSGKPSAHPSQATTVSRVSTPEKPTPPQGLKASHLRRPILSPSHNSDNVDNVNTHPTIFQNFSDTYPSLVPLPSQSHFPTMSSQLLSPSQMLPDTLIRDDARPPPELWDSQL